MKIIIIVIVLLLVILSYTIYVTNKETNEGYDKLDDVSMIYKNAIKSDEAIVIVINMLKDYIKKLNIQSQIINLNLDPIVIQTDDNHFHMTTTVSNFSLNINGDFMSNLEFVQRQDEDTIVFLSTVSMNLIIGAVDFTDIGIGIIAPFSDVNFTNLSIPFSINANLFFNVNNYKTYITCNQLFNNINLPDIVRINFDKWADNQGWNYAFVPILGSMVNIALYNYIMPVLITDINEKFDLKTRINANVTTIITSINNTISSDNAFINLCTQNALYIIIIAQIDTTPWDFTEIYDPVNMHNYLYVTIENPWPGYTLASNQLFITKVPGASTCYAINMDKLTTAQTDYFATVNWTGNDRPVILLKTNEPNSQLTITNFKCTTNKDCSSVSFCYNSKCTEKLQPKTHCNDSTDCLTGACAYVTGDPAAQCCATSSSYINNNGILVCSVQPS